MAVERLSQASILTLQKYSSMVAGAAAPGDYELVSTTILGSNAASVTFTGLDTSASAYKHLQIRITSRTTSTADAEEVRFRFNGDTGVNYQGHYLYGTGSAGASGAMGASGNGYGYYTSAANATSGFFGAAIMDILDFNSTNKNKIVKTWSGNQFIVSASSVWVSTAAITSITLFPGGNLLTGSRFSLYGLRG